MSPRGWAAALALTALAWGLIIAATGRAGALALALVVTGAGAYLLLLLVVTTRDSRRASRRPEFPDAGGHVRRRWPTSTR